MWMWMHRFLLDYFLPYSYRYSFGCTTMNALVFDKWISIDTV